MTITVDNIKSNMLGVALSRTIEGKKERDKRKDYGLCKAELEEQLAKEGDKLNKATPFYKNGDKTNIAGYVIETDNKTMVCYHGTRFKEALSGHGKQEVKNDLNSKLTNMKFGDAEHSVHEGFKKEYESSKDSLYEILNNRKNKTPIDFTGHSLGGAVAGIAALDAATNRPEIKIGSVVNFGCPRFLSPKAAKLYKAIGLSDKTLRVKQTLDPVPRVPPKSIFQHVGNSIKMDASPYFSLVHGSGVYKKIIDKLTDQDLSKQKASRDYNSFAAYKYIVNKLEKSALLKAMDRTFKIRQNLDKMRKAYYGDNIPHNKKTISNSLSI